MPNLRNLQEFMETFEDRIADIHGERDFLILQAVLEEVPVKQIAKVVGVSPQRIYQILKAEVSIPASELTNPVDLHDQDQLQAKLEEYKRSQAL